MSYSTEKIRPTENLTDLQVDHNFSWTKPGQQYVTLFLQMFKYPMCYYYFSPNQHKTFCFIAHDKFKSNWFKKEPNRIFSKTETRPKFKCLFHPSLQSSTASGVWWTRFPVPCLKRWLSLNMSLVETYAGKAASALSLMF